MLCGGQTNRQTDKPTDTQTDRETDGRTGRRDIFVIETRDTVHWERTKDQEGEGQVNRQEKTDSKAVRNKERFVGGKS